MIAARSRPNRAARSNGESHSPWPLGLGPLLDRRHHTHMAMGSRRSCHLGLATRGRHRSVAIEAAAFLLGLHAVELVLAVADGPRLHGYADRLCHPIRSGGAARHDAFPITTEVAAKQRGEHLIICWRHALVHDGASERIARNMKACNLASKFRCWKKQRSRPPCAPHARTTLCD